MGDFYHSCVSERADFKSVEGSMLFFFRLVAVDRICNIMHSVVQNALSEL